MYIPWRKRISRTIGVAAQTKNGLLIVDPRDFGVSRSLLTQGSYDWSVISWLAPLLGRESRMVFVGAHLGALLIPLALQSGSRDIVAFEPNPSTHQLLEINLALNELDDVTIHRLAVGDRKGSIGFTQNRLNSGNSRVSQTGEVVVAMTTLDSALYPDSSAVDLLVMDAEGFEVHAIRGATQTLARTRYFYVEYAPEQLIEQGSSPEQFIERLASQFESMYLPGEPARFFPSHTYVRYLSELPQRRGLLLNLLFTHDATPEAVLLAALR
jgi:FkbM family methyltransferase